MSVHVFPTMGTMVSIRFADGLPDDVLLAEVEREFERFDDRFSLYRPDSELSQVARGELALTGTTELLRDAYARAVDWRARTNDAFTPHRPDGIIDLSGLVKADAIEAAGSLLLAAGESNWVVNAGGDILSSGCVDESAWGVGIADPDDRSALLATVKLSEGRRAMATSGTAERGEHVWRSDRSSRYRQVTVLAADIVTVDVLSTAILAGGEPARDDALARFDIDLLTVDQDGELTATAMLTGRRVGR